MTKSHNISESNSSITLSNIDRESILMIKILVILDLPEYGKATTKTKRNKKNTK